MKNILCLGDSNTWGYDPVLKKRFPRDKRWTGILQALAGPDFYIIEEGLNGRTTVWDDPVEGWMGDKNGQKILPTLLSTHCPLDLLIIMLGTNDFKKRFSVSAFEISLGIDRLIKEAKSHDYFPSPEVPEILVVAPPRIAYLADDFKEHFDESTVKQSALLSGCLRESVKRSGCWFLDAAAFTDTSGTDGVHLSGADQPLMASKILDKMNEIFI